MFSYSLLQCYYLHSLIGLRVCILVLELLVFDFTDASFVYSVIVKARIAFKMYKMLKIKDIIIQVDIFLLLIQDVCFNYFYISLTIFINV